MSDKILSISNKKKDWDTVVQSCISLLKEVTYSAIIESCSHKTQVEVRFLYIRKESIIKIYTNSERKKSFIVDNKHKVNEKLEKSIKLSEVELEARVVTIINALTPLIREIFVCEYKVDKRSLLDSEILFYLKQGELSSIKEITYRFNQTCKFPPPKKY